MGGAWDPREKEKWQAGTPNHPTPKQRGFDDFYGIMDAASSFFRPESLMDGDKFIDISTLWKKTEDDVRKALKGANLKFVESIGDAAFPAWRYSR